MFPTKTGPLPPPPPVAATYCFDPSGNMIAPKPFPGCPVFGTLNNVTVFAETVFKFEFCPTVKLYNMSREVDNGVVVFICPKEVDSNTRVVV